MAAFGGLAIELLNGLDIPKIGRFKGLTTRGVFGRVKLPLLLGMIVMGMIARNYFGISVAPYKEAWAGYLREVCVCILLMRGGLLI